MARTATAAEFLAYAESFGQPITQDSLDTFEETLRLVRRRMLLTNPDELVEWREQLQSD